MTKRELGLFLAILAVAAVARMGWPGLTEFKADEARLLKLAFDMADGGRLALRGIGSSVGFPNFPMSVWLYALPSFLSLHPYAATIFTGLLNTLAIVGCFWLVRRYWGTDIALLTMLLLAVSPWAILYSRKIWAQNLLPLFVLGWAASGVLAFIEGRRRFLWLHLLCLAIVVQIHLAAIGLVPATAVYLLVFRRRLVWRDLIIGGFLGLITAVPFLLYLNQNGTFTRLLNRNTASLATESAQVAWTDGFHFVWLLSTGREIHSLAGPVAFQSYLARVPDLTAVHFLYTLLILLGIVVVVQQAWQNWQEPRSQVGLFVLVWLLVPPLFFAFWRSSPIFLHYFIVTLPAQFVVIGIGVQWLVAQTWLQAGSRMAVWAVLIAAAALQLYIWVALLSFINSTPTPGGFGISLAQRLEGVEKAKQLLLTNDADEVLVAGLGEVPDVDAFPAMYEALLYNTPHRYVDVTRSTLFPAKTAVVLLDTTVKAGLYRTLPIIEGQPATDLPLVFLLFGQSAPAPAQTVEPVPIWANWMSLAGYSGLVGQEGGETAVWQLHWHTAANPDPNTYHFFNHLLDANGQRLAQADAAVFTPAQWREGDIVISTYNLPWSDAAQTMRVGVYQYPTLENISIFDVAGNPASETLELPITR